MCYISPANTCLSVTYWLSNGMIKLFCCYLEMGVLDISSSSGGANLRSKITGSKM